jgi:hypothetical protein
MAIIKVFTDDGQEVDSTPVNDTWSDNAISRHVIGSHQTIHGWLGRALADAAIVQQGGDPERPSEKVMRLLSQRKE